MGKIYLLHPKSGAKVARGYQAEEMALAGTLMIHGADAQSRIRAFEAVISEIETKGSIDDYVAAMHFPGKFDVYLESIVKAGNTGKPAFESLVDGYDYWIARQKRRAEEERKIVREQEERVAIARGKREIEFRKQQETELAARLGISPARLAELQGKENEATSL
ncbi:MAG: hypothetical protein ACREBU_19040 [Nitrososphaera sp.]